MLRVWYATIDDQGNEIRVTQDIEIGTVPITIEITPAPTMAEYDQVRPPDPPVKQDSLGTVNIPKEKQIAPTFRAPAHDCVR